VAHAAFAHVTVWPAAPRVLRRVALDRRLAMAGRLWCRQGLLHRLRARGLQGGGWPGGGRRWDGALPCARGRTRLAEEVEVGVPLACLVRASLDLWPQVLHTTGPLGIGDVSQGVSLSAAWRCRPGHRRERRTAGQRPFGPGCGRGGWPWS